MSTFIRSRTQGPPRRKGFVTKFVGRRKEEEQDGKLCVPRTLMGS